MGRPRTLVTCCCVVGAVMASGCGGDDEEPALVAASSPDRTLTAQIPDPLAAERAQAPGTFVGRAGDGRAYVALVVRGDEAVAYWCDGAAGDWFGARVADGELAVRSAAGTELRATREDGAWVGTLRRSGSNRSERFTARPPRGADEGVYAGPDAALPGYVRRWIVLADGVRGVSTKQVSTSGDAASGSSGEVQDGTSNTVAVTESPQNGVAAGEGAEDVKPAPAATVRDGSSNTIIVGEETRTSTAPRGTGTVSDGSSNTIIVGEETRTSTAPRGTSTVNDGSSNTIILGEQTQTQTSTTRTSTTPRGTSTVSDGTSNTITTGERSVVAGGSFLPCRSLTLLTTGLRLSTAPAAARQLRAFRAQARVNGC